VVPADARGGSGREESEEERVDRNLGELLQELRVASIGVQVLFGFLLSLPFSTRFARLSDAEQSLYLVALLFAALSTALLIAPVAYHRLVFRLHQKDRLLRTANLFAVLGLTTVAITVSVSVVLVVSVVIHGAPVVLVAVVTGGIFLGLWFALPLRVRRTAEHEQK
jgi:Family of unknown function (DUF6328)